MITPGSALLADTLGHLAEGETSRARALLDSPRARESLLGRELRRYLDARQDGRVYDHPAAFRSFIDGGGNCGLYERTSARLARAYGELGARTVLDIGCGDGRAVIAALTRSPAPLARLDLLEPSPSLLATAESDAMAHGLPVRAHDGTLQDFLRADPGSRWDLAQATFALSAVAPAQRSEALAALLPRAANLVIAEFDVPAFDARAFDVPAFDVPAFGDRGHDHLTYLAERYERGLAEYDGDGGLVAQGFLIPVLLGQVEPDRVRHTWEQPARLWECQLTESGWSDVRSEPLADFWWAPAVVVTARGGSPPEGAMGGSS